MDMPEQERREALQDAGMDKDDSQEVEHIHGSNILLDQTKGIQHLNETMELFIEGLEDALDNGPLANEPVQGTLIRLSARRSTPRGHHPPRPGTGHSRDPERRPQGTDRREDQDARADAGRSYRIDVPNDHMGAASGEIQGRRGRVDDMYQEGVTSWLSRVSRPSAR